MRRQPRLFFVALIVSSMALTGCASSSALQGASGTRDGGVPVRVGVVEVHRSPGCGCCHEWEAYLRDQGYEVRASDDPDIAAFKASLGVPASSQACHTALIDGYVVEGHVPVAAIEDLLQERPGIDGIALAGMPPGSPGMSGVQQGPFEVVSFAEGGAFAFGSY
jgi:hypothetical protein